MLRAILIAVFLLAAGQATEALTEPEAVYRLVQGLGDAERGRVLAEEHCFECHTPSGSDVLASFPPAPPFDGLAGRSYDRESLTVALAGPSHPDFLRAVLAPSRIDDLLAYLLAVRDGGPGAG